MGAAPGRCPACQRFIGPLDTCPFCDCPSERQASLRLLRGLALALALGGLVLLAWSARARETPRLAIGAIRPGMNFARVEVTGRMVREPRSGKARSGDPWFGFTLADGTNQIRVQAYGPAAEGLEAAFRDAPRGTGALIRAEGSLALRAGREPTLQVREAAHVAMLREEP